MLSLLVFLLQEGQPNQTSFSHPCSMIPMPIPPRTPWCSPLPLYNVSLKFSHVEGFSPRDPERNVDLNPSGLGGIPPSPSSPSSVSARLRCGLRVFVAHAASPGKALPIDLLGMPGEAIPQKVHQSTSNHPAKVFSMQSSVSVWTGSGKSHEVSRVLK